AHDVVQAAHVQHVAEKNICKRGADSNPHAIEVVSENTNAAETLGHHCGKTDEKAIVALLRVRNNHVAGPHDMPVCEVSSIVFDALVFVAATFVNRIKVMQGHSELGEPCAAVAQTPRDF